MSARYQVVHDTHYRYATAVSLAKQLAHLWPRDCAWQRCIVRELKVEPAPTQRRDELDIFGNPLTRLAFERPHEELRVEARLDVEILARPPLDPRQSPPWEEASAALSYSGAPLSAEVLEASRFRFESPAVRLKYSFVDYAEDCFTAGRPLLQGAQATVLNAPWAAIAPGVMIVAIVLGANFLADGLRERFDPTRRTRA